jgi:hypothetical protein
MSAGLEIGRRALNPSWFSAASLAEGVLDLAFREETPDFDGWTVVDFKTDRGFSSASGHYLAQVGLAVKAATGLPTRGIILVV